MIAKKMAWRLGGTPEQYKQFIAQRENKKGWEIMKEYCAANNIEWKCP